MYKVFFETPIINIPSHRFLNKEQAKTFKAEHEYGKFASLVKKVGKLNIGIDIDGCLHNFVQEFSDWTYIKTGHRFNAEEPLSWAFYNDWGMDSKEFYSLYREGVASQYLFRSLAAWTDGVEAIQKLYAAGHLIHILTSRNIEGLESIIESSTKEWLNSQKIPYTTLNITNTSKAKTAISLEIDIILDDAIHHYDELTKAGCIAVLLSRKYNINHSSANRVESWNDFVNLIQEQEK